MTETKGTHMSPTTPAYLAAEAPFKRGKFMKLCFLFPFQIELVTLEDGILYSLSNTSITGLHARCFSERLAVQNPRRHVPCVCPRGSQGLLWDPTPSPSRRSLHLKAHLLFHGSGSFMAMSSGPYELFLYLKTRPVLLLGRKTSGQHRGVSAKPRILTAGLQKSLGCGCVVLY